MLPWAGLARRAVVAVALVWLGVVIGVSLLAAPVPFMVAELDRPAALAVNRQLFGHLSLAELGLLALVVAAALAGRLRAWLAAGVAVLGLVVLIQAFVLLPELARRTDLVLAGREPADGPWHGLYVGLELLKLGLLPALALGAARALEAEKRAERCFARNDG